MRKKRVSISVFQIFIALIIIIALIIGIIVVKKNVVSIGEINTKKMGDFAGSGTSQEPYKIEKVEDIVKLSENVKSGKSYKDCYFELSNKLDFQSEESYKNSNVKYGDLNGDGQNDDIKTELTTGKGFPAIGTENCAFEGIFNGNDKTIKNLNFNVSENREETMLVGLFGNNKGKILNLKVVSEIVLDENVSGKAIYVGTIAAKNSGIIQACKTEGNITANINDENVQGEIAGITAENYGKILDSANSINIISNQLKAGIVAKNIVDESIEESGEITNCTNDGKVSENTGTMYLAAGIVADNQNGSITSCNNNGKIEGKIVGGIAGKSTGNIVACQNAGMINNLKEDSKDEEYAGGICAIIDMATIENSKNTGDILGTTNVGGIVGENKGKILQSKNEGKLSKVEEVICRTVNIGGIAGKNSSSARISNSKNYGSIESETDTTVNMGGICGLFYGDSEIEYCENNGGMNGSAKDIIPNEDKDEKCTSCTSNNGGSASLDEFGQLNIGIIYGKFQEI